MPAKEIKELRQAGKLEEAYTMAKVELEADLSNIWGKRNLSWVLYAQLDELASNLDAFIVKINEVKELDLPASEEMFYENISIVIAKAARVITHEPILDINKMHRLFDSIKELSLKRNSKWFSVLFNAMHKGMKESNRYIEFADWWDFENFRAEDFQKEKMPNGKEVMAIAEQAYIAYAKHLLPKQTQHGEIIFNNEKAEAFLPVLSQIVKDYPQFQYPAYFNAKLLLALGDKDNMLKSLLPFARKKRNDFWVWEVLSEAFQAEPDKVLACLCRALYCKSHEEMLVKIRQRLASMLIERQEYGEAKTEIELLIAARSQQGFGIPPMVTEWVKQDWYQQASAKSDNHSFYRQYLEEAEALLFADLPEELIFADYINTDKKILQFITRTNKTGFFRYDRLLKSPKAGDVLRVRFQEYAHNAPSKVFTARVCADEADTSIFVRDVSGVVRVDAGNPFGFLGEAYIHPSIIEKRNLKNGQVLEGKMARTFNHKTKTFGWKLI